MKPKAYSSKKTKSIQILPPMATPLSILQSNNVNSAEKMVSKALEPLIAQGWVILANVSYTDLDNPQSKRGEADFILFGPQGFLVLEVKGGELEWSEDGLGQLFQKSSIQQNAKLIDPWQQAKKSAAFIFEEAKRYYAKYEDQPKISWGYAAVFPQAELRVIKKGSNEVENLFLDHQKLGQFATEIPKILLKFCRESDRETHHSQQFWLDFVNHGLTTQIEYKIVNHKLQEEIIQVRRNEQEQLSNFLPALLAGAPMRQTLFEGGAGTGKTLLLIEKAVQLSRKFDHVLVLCFNLPLRDFLIKSLKKRDSACLVLGIHELAEKLLHAIDPDAHDATIDRTEWFNHKLYERVIPHIDDQLRIFDAILIDEAQDFHQEQWWHFVRKLHKDEHNGEWVIAWDPNQCIYADSAQKQIEKPLERAARIQTYMPGQLQTWKLSVNFRNAAKIHQKMKDMLQTDEQSAYLPDTQDAVYSRKLAGKSESHIFAEFNAILRVAREDYGLSHRQITILGPRTLPNSILRDLVKSTKIPVTDREDQRTDQHLFYSTIQRYKGLESDAVILVGFDPKNEEHQRLKWLALSRARFMCWIVENSSIGK